MSAPDPLTPPSPPTSPAPTTPPAPSFEPYQAPAYGDVAPERPGTTPLPGRPHPGQPYPGQPYPGQPWPANPYQVAPQYLAHQAAPSHPQAVLSLVLGIVGIVGIVLTPVLGFTLLAGICSPFAIWLGARAKREIRDRPHQYGGTGLAMGGFVTGIVGTVLAILGLLAILATIAFVVLLFSGV